MILIQAGSFLGLPVLPDREFPRDRPYTKAFDTRRTRLVDRIRAYDACAQDTGFSSGKADYLGLRRRDRERPGCYRRRSDPDYGKRIG
jgi:hypothetical protein